jgi:hypothetical protein
MGEHPHGKTRKRQETPLRPHRQSGPCAPRYIARYTPTARVLGPRSRALADRRITDLI